MKKASVVVLAYLVSLLPLPVFSQERIHVVGIVSDLLGNPVQGAAIVVQDSITRKTLASATSDVKGEYIIGGISPGQYLLTLDPQATGMQGQTVAIIVGEIGLTVSWIVSPTTPAKARAMQGIATRSPWASNMTPASIFGFGVLGAAGAVGIAVGSAALAGEAAKDGPPPPPEASPSA